MKRPYMKIISTAVSAILLTNSAAVAGLTFGDWATAQGYTPPGPTDWECDASNKGITTAEGANSYINLLELNLWGNQIPSLSVDHFQGLTNLQTLRVGDNQITSLSANQFQALTSLQRLFISHNQIPSVDVQAFQGLSDLTMLYLGNNQLSSLSANQFQGLGSLEELDLQVNQISSMDSDAFLGLDNLQILYICWNEISSLSADHFRGLLNLEYLNLASNQIASLSPSVFQGLDGLVTLDLRDNQIVVLDLTGCDLPALRCFYIDDNPVADVILADATLPQSTFDALMTGPETTSSQVGIAELAGIISVDFSRADLSGVDQFDEMCAMADLETLVLADTIFSGAISSAGYSELWDLISALDAQHLDALTVNEKLYAAMQTDLDAWDAGAGNVLTVVPEPAIFSLLALGGLVVIHRRRKHQP